MSPDADNLTSGLMWRLLDEPLIRWRCAEHGDLHQSSLPQLMSDMRADRVGDFPALRAHQRHPWHAFLVQLAAIALDCAGERKPWREASQWRAALLALTPDDPDGAAWSLIAPVERPALFQPPVPEGSLSAWKNRVESADELDMLVTSKNHDVKGARMRKSRPDDWLFSLVSLQTQEGFLGAGNYGVSRMNGGFASRPGVGISPVGAFGQRWAADVESLIERRESVTSDQGLAYFGGHALLWLLPWTGTDSLAFAALDPWYIEICRRVRLVHSQGTVAALVTGSKASRVAAKERNGVTGDPWTPIDASEAKALTVSAGGFDYKLMTELLSGERYAKGAAWRLDGWPRDASLEVVAQVTVRGQGKTEGYHERRVPISPKLRSLLSGPRRVTVAEMAKQRVDAIAAVRKLLWSSLVTLFANGDSADRAEGISERAARFAKPFEQHEDKRFFDDLAIEVEVEPSEAPAQRLVWLMGLADRAEAVLQTAFAAGPRSGMQRYKAQSSALARFRGGLRGSKSVLPALALHYAQERKTSTHSTHGGHFGG